MREGRPKGGQRGWALASKEGAGGDSPSVPSRTRTLRHASVVAALDAVAVVEPADGGVGQAGHLALQHGLLGQSHVQILQRPQEVGHGQPLQLTLLGLLGDGGHLLQLGAVRTTQWPRGLESHLLPQGWGPRRQPWLRGGGGGGPQGVRSKRLVPTWLFTLRIYFKRYFSHPAPYSQLELYWLF